MIDKIHWRICLNDRYTRMDTVPWPTFVMKVFFLFIFSMGILEH